MKLAITVFVALVTATAHAQTPLQAQSQIYTNQFPSARITNAVVQGETNVVPVQPWTIQVIEVITILRSQRDELRAMLTNTPLLSLPVPLREPTKAEAEAIQAKTEAAIKAMPSLIGPPAPPKTPKRKPRP